MKTILITGASGFIGKNLTLGLSQVPSYTLKLFDRNHTLAELEQWIMESDFIIHLAGVNRPEDPDDFYIENVGLTENIIYLLEKHHKNIPLIMSSSIHAKGNSLYGQTKQVAEETLQSWSRRTGNTIFIYRFSNIFGKWCKPYYNSVIATFCYNITHNLPIRVDNPTFVLNLIYIDDIVKEFIEVVEGHRSPDENGFCQLNPTYSLTLQELSDVFYSFHANRHTLVMPNLELPLHKYLYATYLSYLDPLNCSYELDMKVDSRGSLAEFIKSNSFGQIFISKTKPGVTRGNHWHYTKCEKFLVIDGNACVRLRHVVTKELFEFNVSGNKLEVIDIPVGYTHTIENIGTTELITLFWASEPFNPNAPDTYFLNV
ncbi:MAG: NAD-dependent epimerase/dehydratase family protein [Cellulosilyticaceae bacterium]